MRCYPPGAMPSTHSPERAATHRPRAATNDITTPRIFVRALRLAVWNAALILAGLALIAIAAEAWLRLTTPSFTRATPSRFVPGVGVLYEPHAEVRHTNGLDFWTVQRANSLGFLDREPPDPARAAASCHVAVFGDSFVDALQVPIADKLHVRLETLAAHEAAELDVTASAYGRWYTAQVNQLPYYDEYARRLRPNLLVLVFVENDFDDGRTMLRALRRGWDPARAADAYREPHNGRRARYEDAARLLTERSLFARWLDGKRRAFGVGVSGDEDGLLSLINAPQATLVVHGAGFGWVLDGREPPPGLLDERLSSEDTQPDWRTLTDDGIAAWSEELTAWGLAGFKGRADRDGAALVVLATHTMDGSGDPKSALLRSMTDPLGIPVIDQLDWIVRSGGRVEDAYYRHDHHWTPQGHQWAAEALFDWLRRHPETCED